MKNIRKIKTENTKLLDGAGNFAFEKPIALNVILDIDQTLVYTEQYKDDLKNMLVIARPFATPFVNFCYRATSDVTFFTGADLEPSEVKLDFIRAKRIRKILYYKHTKKYMAEDVLEGYKLDYKRKDLRYGGQFPIMMKVVPNFDPNNTLIIDDQAEFYPDNQRSNVAQISQYKATYKNEKWVDYMHTDKTLVYVAELIKTIGKQKVRDIPGAIMEYIMKYPESFSVPEKRAIGDIIERP